MTERESLYNREKNFEEERKILRQEERLLEREISDRKRDRERPIKTKTEKVRLTES